jgi:SAM-dependent methyltransferase
VKPVHKYSLLDHNWLVLERNNAAIKEHLGLMNGVVYDLGCGVRPYEDAIRATAKKYVGVDWAHTLHGLHADVVADLNQMLPVPDGAADTVVCFQVMEHLREPQHMLYEAFRILKPGGRIILTVPFQWWVHEAPYDYFRFTRYGLEHMFRKAGFADLCIKEVSGFWAMWFLKLNYQTRRLIRGPRVVRWLVHALLTPLWIVDQSLARLFDRHWRSPEETFGYIVIGRKA